MAEMALGVTVFKRTNKLRELLDTVDGNIIDRVIVADNGNITPEKQRIYDAFSATTLTILDVKYDAGLGYSRDKIVNELEEEYLLLVDSDVKLPNNVDLLRDQLRAEPEFGGIGGVLWEDTQIRSDCFDLHENGDSLIRDTNTEKRIRRVAGGPLVEFDVIQNVALFRRECLEDYSWDPEFKIGGEHIDFFVGHKQETEWQFGLNPNVLFKHNPGGDANYLQHREDINELRKSKQRFLEKWEYNQVVNGHMNWLRSRNRLPSIRESTEDIIKRVLLSLPGSVQAPLMNLRDRLRIIKGKPPF